MARLVQSEEFQRKLCAVVGLDPSAVRSIAVTADAGSLPVVKVYAALTEEQLNQMAPLLTGVLWQIIPADSPRAVPSDEFTPADWTQVVGTAPPHSVTVRVPASAVREVGRDRCGNIAADSPVTVGG